MSKAWKPGIVIDRKTCGSCEKWIEQVLDVLGRPEAMVTDLSRICDFFTHVDGADDSSEDMREREALKRLGRKAGRVFRYDSLIVEVAQALETQANKTQRHGDAILAT